MVARSLSTRARGVICEFLARAKQGVKEGRTKILEGVSEPIGESNVARNAKKGEREGWGVWNYQF